MKEEFNSKSVAVLMLAYLGMAVMGITIQIVTPVSNEIREGLGISFRQMGLLMGIISFPGIFLAIPVGYLADRCGSRLMLLFGALFMALSFLVFPLLPGYLWFVAGRLMAGIGCTFISVLLPGLIPQYFRGKSLGTAMGVYNTALSVGSIATLTFFHALADRSGVLNAFWYPFGLACLLLVLYLFFLPASSAVKKVRFSLPLQDSFWLLVLIVLFANLASMGYVTIAPAYYETLLIPWSVRGTMLSAVLWGGIFFAPLAGYLTSARGKGVQILVAGALLQALGLALIPVLREIVAVPLILLAVGAGVIMTPVYTLIPRIAQPQEINVYFAAMFSAMMIGCLAGPLFVGWIYDIFLSYKAAFLFLGLMSAGAAVSACFVRLKDGPGGNER